MEEVKTDMGVDQKPIWGKQPKHAIDALSYVIATINKPRKPANMTATTDLAKQYYPEIGV